MRIYIAAPYAVRDHLRICRDSLVANGHLVVASWLDATHEIHAGTLETAPDLDDDYARSHALKDIDEVSEADLVIVVTWPKAQKLAGTESLGGNSGGRHVETGVALALGIPVLVWGQPENIFHRGVCASAENWANVLEHVAQLHDQRFGIAPTA